MKAQVHHIVKQVFELSFPSGTDGFEVHQNFSKYYYSTIQHQLASLFDELVQPDQLVRINKLEIDLGRLNLNELTSDELVRRILQALREQIDPAIKTNYSKIPADKLTLPEGASQRWLFFLKYGQLPWRPEYEKREWEEKILEGLVQHPYVLGELMKMLRNSSNAQHRLVWQCSDDFLVSLFAIITGHAQNDLIQGWEKAYLEIIDKKKSSSERISEKINELSNGFGREDITRNEFRHEFWMNVIKSVFIKGNKKGPEYLLEDVLEQMQLSENYLSNKTHSPDKKNGKILISEDSETMDQTADMLSSENKESGLCEWYIENAGMILLHPYLTRFLNTVGLIRNGKFADTEKQAQAIHLMQYLTSGEVGVEEYELVLPKVLCGMPVQCPVAREVELDPDWLEEADHLLEVVVQQWKALGEVSTASLREGFLSRPGKLSKKENGWLLQVEQKAIDVLLDRLPWGLSLVKFPWMKEMMHVEWR